METIYCDLEVKKVRTGALASGGGTAGDGVAYAIVPRRRPLPKRAGKVLDFEACRRKLERSAAGREETTAECPACPEDGAAQRAVGATWARRLELWATAAVLTSHWRPRRGFWCGEGIPREKRRSGQGDLRCLARIFLLY